MVSKSGPEFNIAIVGAGWVILIIVTRHGHLRLRLDPQLRRARRRHWI